MTKPLTGKDLMLGLYYNYDKYGIGRYTGTTIYNGDTWYKLEYRAGKFLLLKEENLADISEIPSSSDKNIRLGTLGMNKKDIIKFGKEEALTATKDTLIRIESYKNILSDGLEEIKKLKDQHLKIDTIDNKKFESLILDLLNKPLYVAGNSMKKDIQYEEDSKLAIINYKVPNNLEVPRIIKYTYDQIFDRLNGTEMKIKDFNSYYESIVFQITLRTIKEVFTVTDNDKIESVVFNGIVECIDSKTGNNFSSCIVSVMTSREDFEKINLSQVSPKDCVMFLKGIFSGSLHQLAPVKPIMDINKEDRRFTYNKEVLSKLNEGVNLAEMDWEDFEHLVRELFEKMFSSDGSEVKVTQASRDGGVDAVAFDTDPIKGGKFIIQAKRYNNVVPVSAVRDLYGTVINEGAIKGILVTTSYFGNDSREFSKDKPIALIDGANIVYLLNKYGYKTHIELKKNKNN